MDINQLYYFTVIVESGCNFTTASKEIHISQPALSQIVINFEKEHQVSLFKRSGGRLQCLTHAGELLYEHAKEIIRKRNIFLEELQTESKQLRGKIKLGIPPVIISVFFPDLLPRLISKNPGIHIELLELGAVELQKEFIAENIPMAVLLAPTNLDLNKYEQVNLSKNKLTAFMNKEHLLSTQKDISWTDLDGQSLATFNSNYKIHHLIMDKLKEQGVNPTIALQSSSWDLQLNATRNSDLITILPAPVTTYFDTSQFKQLYFDDSLIWEIVLCRKKKTHYSFLENFLFQSIIDYFE